MWCKYPKVVVKVGNEPTALTPFIVVVFVPYKYELVVVPVIVKTLSVTDPVKVTPFPVDPPVLTLAYEEVVGTPPPVRLTSEI